MVAVARMKTPRACLTCTIHGPGLGRAESDAPAIGHGKAMPTPRTKGSERAIAVPVAYRLLENKIT